VCVYFYLKKKEKKQRPLEIKIQIWSYFLLLGKTCTFVIQSDLAPTTLSTLLIELCALYICIFIFIIFCCSLFLKKKMIRLSFLFCIHDDFNF
jgi:hypothetical protein